MRDTLRIALFAPRSGNCGVGDYSERLSSHLLATAPAGWPNLVIDRHRLLFGPIANVAPLILSVLGSRYDVVHLQYHPALLSGSSRRFHARILGRLNYLAILLVLLGRKFVRSRISGLVERGLLRPKFFITVHGLATPVRTSLSAWLRRSDCIIVHSESSRAALISGGIPYQRIVVVPIGANHADRTTCESGETAGAGESHQVKVVLFGFIHEAKGHHVAIQALSLLPEPYRLVICGAPRLRAHQQYLDRLRMEVRRNGLEERVEFTGFVPDSEIGAILSQAACAVFPYMWRDGWQESSAALSMALGYELPVIASDTPVFRGINDRYGCMQLVQRGDARVLARVIRQVAENLELQERLREGTRRYLADTSWESVAKLTLRTYIGFAVDHPDSLYDEAGQRERVAWLRQKAIGTSLEIGCATGFVTEVVGEAVGIDLRLDRLGVAKRLRSGLDFLAADATRLPFPDDSFDTVLMPEVLDHLPRDLATGAIVEAGRVARSLLLATVGRAESEGYAGDATAGARNREHLWVSDRRGLTSLFGGFEVELVPSSDGRFWLLAAMKVH